MAEQRILVEIEGSPEKQAAEQEGQPIAGKPRLKVINREQLVMRTIDLEKSIGEDHPARAIWAMVERLDMSRFEAMIKAVEGHAGQSRLDPRILIALWIYANSEGISSARELSRL